MAYGTVKVDNITFDNGGSDQNVTVSGLYRATTSGVTVSGTVAAGTISGVTVIGSTTVSGVTVTGTTANFTSGNFGTLVTVTGTASANIVSGVTIIGSTTVSGATVTGTTANFTSGNFSNLISAAATMSGALIMANQQQVRFREAVGNGVNHIALQAPAIVSADQTITLPDQTGTVVTTGDNGSVTSTMILDGTILNDDINASAGIVDTKLDTIATAGKVSNSATTATDANTASAIVARSAAGNFNITSINNGPLAGMRNAIINGNFDIWQRGTSFTSSEYGADRWIHLRGGTTHTVTRQAFTLGQTNVPGEPTYYCRTVVSSVAGAGSYAILAQYIEDVRTFAGQQVTVSFWAKVDATKNIAVEIEQHFGTGGSPSAAVTAIGVTKVSIGTSWQKVTVTASIPSISGKTLGNNGNSNLRLNIWFDAGSSSNARTDTLGQQSGTFEIAKVQVEPGPVATPFERRPIGTELALCQRYFNKSYAVGTNPGTVTTAGQFAGSFAAAGTGSIDSIVRYPVVMRSTATVTIYNPVTGASNSARRGGSNITPTQGSGADSGVIVIITGSSADNYAHHYTASAEL